MKRKREHSFHLEAVCIHGWRALAIRQYTQLGRGVLLSREEVPWFVGEMQRLLVASTGRIPNHIARNWGPLRVLVSPTGVRIWRNSGSWPVEGVAITSAEVPHVVEAVARGWS